MKIESEKESELMIEDEYKIKPILDQFNILYSTGEVVLNAITKHLDKVVTVYLQDRDGIRKSAFIETKVYLQKALIDTEDDETLRERISEIIEAIK